MKEIISKQTLREATVATKGESFGGTMKLEEVHCSWCTNCSSIVGS